MGPNLEQEQEEGWALIDQAAELALDCLKKRVPFSLVGFSRREDGEVIMHHITASNDDEMFDKAIKALALGFALIGEGQVGSGNGKPSSALICYYEHRSLEGPAQMFRPYSKSFFGMKLEDEGWRLIGQLDSWL